MKWTKRQDGVIRTTLYAKLHVPREFVEWLRDNSNMSTEKAICWTRDNASWFDGWNTVGVQHGAMVRVPSDDSDSYAESGITVYTGELPTL